MYLLRKTLLSRRPLLRDMELESEIQACGVDEESALRTRAWSSSERSVAVKSIRVYEREEK